MTTALTTFEDNVKSRVKEIVADLIPEAQYNKIVESAISDFAKNELPEMVKKELRIIFASRVNAELCKPDWQATYLDGEVMTSQALQEMIVKIAPLILSGMIGSQLQAIVSQIKYNMSSAAQQRY